MFAKSIAKLILDVGDWICSKCNAANSYTDNNCTACNAPYQTDTLGDDK